MGQTPEGIIKMKATIRKKYGVTPDGRSALHVRVGALGGAAGTTGGFASTTVGRDGLTGKERASRYGTIGGTISRRRARSNSDGSK